MTYRIFSAPQFTNPPTSAAGEAFGECSLCKESHRRDRMSVHVRACLKRRAGADAPPTLAGNAKIRILARNGMPVFACIECGGRAVRVCVGCFMEGEATLCAGCTKDHECEYDPEALGPNRKFAAHGRLRIHGTRGASSRHVGL